MDFLTKLYLAGLAALALPVMFHLLRRTPRRQIPFSSLMFLTPSPPRITRRNRLDQLLLLLLRALALALLVLAFARPYFREDAQQFADESVGQRMAVIVDVSASMRRGDLWPQAQQQVATLFAESRPTDQLGLFLFDREVKTLIDFTDPVAAHPQRRAALAKRRMGEQSPTWAASDLGNALATIADRLDAIDQGKAEDARASRIVLISDLQQGASIHALRAYEWPATVQLETRLVAPDDPTNAGLHLVAGDAEYAETLTKAKGARASNARDDADPSRTHRVRVVNAADSRAEQFQLVWLAANGQTLGAPLSVYVPPGHGRIVRVRRPTASGDMRLVLRGDAHAFDNTLFIAPNQRETITVAYLGAEAPDDPQGSRYYLERVFSGSTSRRVLVTVPAVHEPLIAPDAAPPRMAIVVGDPGEQRRAELQRYLAGGGCVLYAVIAADDTTPLSLLDESNWSMEEAEVSDYALLGVMDFSHALLAPFADPRYSDFTRVHFWRYRRLMGLDPQAIREQDRSRVLAWFDNGDAALLERTVGRGQFYLLMTSWRPGDSQLARSSKFVPLLWGMLDIEPQTAVGISHVGEPLRLPASVNDAVTVEAPDGSRAALLPGALEFHGAHQPGIYTLGERRFVVQVEPAESDTTPRHVEELEALGVRLTGVAEREVEDRRQRHLRDVELEGRQKIWRWLLAAVLVVLTVETWVAGRQNGATQK